MLSQLIDIAINSLVELKKYYHEENTLTSTEYKKQINRMAKALVVLTEEN